MYKCCLTLLLSLFLLTGWCSTLSQEKRVQHLLSELRCLVCQNQDLLDSHAPLALDLKARVYDLVKTGQSDEQIKAHLVERFGDFILFKPPVKPATWVLWFAPGLFLLLGVFGLVYWVRRHCVVV